MAFRERALAQKTLVCLLQALEGKTTTVEFRDETSVTGKIEQVDGYMNVDMTDVTYTAPSGATRDFTKFCCQGKFIRYVHVPEDLNVTEAMKDRLQVLRKMPMGGRGGFRGGRGGRGGRGRGGFRGRGGRRGGGGRGGYRRR